MTLAAPVTFPSAPDTAYRCSLQSIFIDPPSCRPPDSTLCTTRVGSTQTCTKVQSSFWCFPFSNGTCSTSFFLLDLVARAHITNLLFGHVQTKRLSKSRDLAIVRKYHDAQHPGQDHEYRCYPSNSYRYLSLWNVSLDPFITPSVWVQYHRQFETITSESNDMVFENKT